MRLRPAKTCATAVLAFALAGCASVVRLVPSEAQKTRDGETVVETIQVANTSWKFLGCLPIASGDPERPNKKTCRWCRDTVTLENQMRMIEAEAQAVGAKRATEVITYRNDEDAYLILFLRSKIHTSAVLVK